MPGAASSKPKRAGAGSPTVHILLVDDEPDILDALRVAIGHLIPGSTVTAVPSAQDALGQMARSPVDAIVTDERMPGMSGSQLLATVGRTHPQVRRVLMTAFSGAQMREQAREAGAELLLIKPFDLKAAATGIQTLVGPASAG